MKCVHCGGEVDSQTVECPYCGSANEEGIRFQQIVSEKIENNKLLEKMLYKKQTPELLNVALSRILFVMLALCILFIGIATLLVVKKEEVCVMIGPKPAECTEGSLAKVYEEKYLDKYLYGNSVSTWRSSAITLIEHMDSGKVLSESQIVTLLGSVKRVMHDDALTEEAREAVLKEVETVFVDVLGFTEEEMALFEVNDPNYVSTLRLSPEAQAELYKLVLEKMEEGR